MLSATEKAVMHMLVNAELCSGCETCEMYCPARAIHVIEGEATISQEECVECGVCYRLGVCKNGGLTPADVLPWPRSIRSILSDPMTEFAETGVTGRGTEEMKTNDVTGRFQAGRLGVAIDVGRPNVGTTLREVDKITRAVARAGVSFETKNPVTFMMADPSKGALRDDVLGERVMSAVVEFVIDEAALPEVLRVISEVSSQVDTVFSVGIISRVSPDGSIPVISALNQLGYPPRSDSKVNVGLGRRI
jgi:Pyruvate/2-oxoacid:ferredoxin oxidoreductase delta subunit